MIFDELDTINGAATRIKVIGVGGAGKNAIDHMIENDVEGVEFIAVNTDAQDLKACKAKQKYLIGRVVTHGQGAGANPEVGRQAALESEDDLHEMMSNTEMVFITCGMGGGTGTGAAPVIARIAREHGCLTVGICTKPFFFEGPNRMAHAVEGLTELRRYVDTLIVIPNQRLLSIIDPSTPLLDAFREVDNVLRKGVQSISDIITYNGLINLDFADIKSVMKDKGTALMGIGVASGANRAIVAARRAITSQLLEVTIAGATNAIVNITASEAVALKEVNDALNEIRNVAGKDVDVIHGTAINNGLGDEIVITVIATGYDEKAQNAGFDISSRIFENASDENIDISEYLNNDNMDEEPDISEETEDKNAEIFDSGLTDKEKRRQEKEAEKARKKQERDAARQKNRHRGLFGRRDDDEDDKEDGASEEKKDTDLPDWFN